MKIIEGGLCAVDDILVSASKDGKYGLAIISNKGSNAAAVFTSNKVVANPITLTKESIKNGKIDAIVVNSGNANCYNGKQGLMDAKLMVKQVADTLNISQDNVAVASTGVIGRSMPMDIISPLIESNLKSLNHSKKSAHDVAKAIMTTDTVPKEISVETTLNDGSIAKIGAVTKGSGMIEPNMGTMLSFIVTDVDATPEELNKSLKEAVNQSFNMIVVDGDESTNDMALLMSTCKSGKIDENFQEALNFVCLELAKMMVKDGEGASKYIEVEVKNAKSVEDAKLAAKSIVKSSLVKSAIFGNDPNWGRILVAIGYSGAEIDANKLSISLDALDDESLTEIFVVKEGVVKALDNTKELSDSEELIKNKEIKITVDLNIGSECASAYGCDLTYDYVKINAEYTT